LIYHRSVSTTPAHTWTCAGCRRRVPVRIETCHCGASREQSLALEQKRAPGERPPSVAAAAALPQGWRGLWRSLPRDVKAMALAAVLVLVTGLGWLLLGPERPAAAPALLGYVDRPVSQRRPSPPPQPPFKLPWWK
jgi:hypothetical protein